MSIELKHINNGWRIVDTGVPGWKTLEQHGRKDLAEKRLAAMLGRASRPVKAGQPAEQPGAAPEPEVDPLLMLMLEGGVRDINARIRQANDVDTLKALEVLERQEYGRNSVLKAIKTRLKALA